MIGLGYAIARQATTEEVIDLAKVVAKYGGIYATHIRDEGDTLEQSVQEAIRIGMEAGVDVVISHLKAYKRLNHGKVVRVLHVSNVYFFYFTKLIHKYGVHNDTQI